MSKVTEELTRIREILEEGQSGEGGGFKTAKVTITYDESTGIVIINLPYIDEDGCIYGTAIVDAGDSREYTVPLGEHGACLTLQDKSAYYLTDLEGSVVKWISDAIITGDCSVVIRNAEVPK